MSSPAIRPLVRPIVLVEVAAALRIQSLTCVCLHTFRRRNSHPPAAQLLIYTMLFTFRIGDPKIVTPDGIVATEEQVQAAKTVKERHKLLVGNELLSDTIFLVGPNDETAVRIPVHSLLLASSSSAFMSMFSGNWKKEDVIRIKDCDPSAMYSVIRWIYSGELVVENGKFPDVKAIAEKYFVTSLMNIFADGHDDMVLSDPWMVLSFATESGNNDLRDKCAQQIAADIRHQMDSAGFMDASEAGIAALLSLPFKYDETDLFEKLLMWSEAKCGRQELEVTPENQRKVMQPFIHMIAFPGMSVHQFADLPCKSGVLTEQEQLLIFKWIVTGVGGDTGFRVEARKGYPCHFWRANERVAIQKCFECYKKCAAGASVDTIGRLPEVVAVKLGLG